MQERKDKNETMIIINKKYEVMSKIGHGQFGQVFRGKNAKTGEYVAIKIEILDTSLKLLKHEVTILNYLRSKSVKNIPFVYWYGIFMQKPTLVMPLYDQSLENWLSETNVSAKIASEIAIQMVSILDNIHNKCVIHRDIKPQNFMWKGNKLFLIDFGLSTVYVDEDKNHIMSKNNQSCIIGTPKFVSVHIHDGIDASRRDDLISVAYMYMYMLGNQHIPWENVQDDELHDESIYAENHILYYKNQIRKQIKMEVKLPLFDYLYNINYSETPDYDELKRLFCEILDIM